MQWCIRWIYSVSTMLFLFESYRHLSSVRRAHDALRARQSMPNKMACEVVRVERRAAPHMEESLDPWFPAILRQSLVLVGSLAAMPHGRVIDGATASSRERQIGSQLILA